MSAVVKICGALDRKDVFGWDEETQAVTITDDERTLEGKEVYDFECDIRGEHDKLQYTLEYHDDGEGFTIHTEKNDIWERMPEPELARLEGILGRE